MIDDEKVARNLDKGEILIGTVNVFNKTRRILCTLSVNTNYLYSEFHGLGEPEMID